MILRDCIAIAALAVLVTLASSQNVQYGNTFPGGVKVGFDLSKPCNQANTGLLQFDPEGSGALQVCNGSDWILAGAGANATVLSRSSEADFGNETSVMMALNEILNMLQPSNQQNSLFCSGNGVFLPGVSSTGDDACECYASNELGHYYGARCSECIEGWEKNAGGKCVVDVQAPSIAVSGSATVYHEALETFVDPLFIVSDNSGETPTISSDKVTALNEDVPGTYHVTYTAIDGSGNTANVSVEVIVQDTVPPVISLSLEGQTVGLAQYDSYTLPSATAADVIDGDVTSSIVVSPFNSSLVGLNEVVYSVEDSSHNLATASFYINVTDINECALPSNDPNAHECHQNASCTPNESTGFYDCTCDPGFAGNGRECSYDVFTVFTYTGGPQYYTVPTGITQVRVKAWAAGSGGGSGTFGAPGGFATCVLPVTPGETYTVIVGGAGRYQASSNYMPGGYGGGGNAGVVSSPGGGSGGGLSGVFTGSSPLTFNSAGQSRSRVIAGGGGGGSQYYNKYGGNSGVGGGTEGGTGSISAVYQSYNYSPLTVRLGYPGTQSAGGRGAIEYPISGVEHDGSALQGGHGAYYSGGGGGGGYFGGGGSSAYVNGGGGSGYVHTSCTNTQLLQGSIGSGSVKGVPPETSDTSYVSGVGTAGSLSSDGGHGLVVISLP